MARKLETEGLVGITRTWNNHQIKIMEKGKNTLVFLNAIEKNENLKKDIMQMLGTSKKRKRIISILYLITMRYRHELRPYYSITDLIDILSVSGGALNHQYAYLLKEGFIKRQTREVGPKRRGGWNTNLAYENMPTKKGIEVVNYLISAYLEYVKVK